MRPRIANSFSGGRSSARMGALLLEKFSDTHDILTTFVNTGCEDERTLEFVDACDKHIFGGTVVWIEAVFHYSGKGPTAKVVTFETASRHGEPFEAAVKKHGVFNRSFPNCTGRLKVDPFHNYMRHQCGWLTGTYDTAIGIRADEIDRCSSEAKKKRLIYPLVEVGITKADVNAWCSQFPWDLKLSSDAWGNCRWCWKKSFRKLMTLAKEDPAIFDFPGEMERKYGNVNRGKGKRENRVFFRGRTSAQEILKRSMTEDFVPYEDEKFEQPENFDHWLDVGSGCGESCEIGADE